MGLFDSDYKYYAYSGSGFLLPDEERKHTVKNLMLQAGITGLASMAEAITLGLNTNMYARARSMVKYARRDDGYIFGLPETDQTVNNVSQEALKPFIEAEVGEPIIYITQTSNPFSNTVIETFFVEKFINENWLNHTYFPWDTELGDPTPPHWSPQMDTVEIPVTYLKPGEEPRVKAYIKANNNFFIGREGTLYRCRWDYVEGSNSWLMPLGFSLDQYNKPGDWIAVRYRKESDADDVYRYWAYLLGSNENPALEAAIESSPITMEYLPISVLMHDTKWFDDPSVDPEWERTLYRLMKKLAVKPATIKEEYLAQQEEDQQSGDPQRGADIEDWDFFVQFAVPHLTKDRYGREYLFHWFEFLRTNLTTTTFQQYQDIMPAPDAELEDGRDAVALKGPQQFSEMAITEGEPYTGYIARFAWSYIERKEVAGIFYPPDDEEGKPLRQRRYWSRTYNLGNPDYNEGLDLVHGAGNYSRARINRDGEEHGYTVVTRQNSDNTHTHLLMMGMDMQYQINTSQVSGGQGEGGYEDYSYIFVDCPTYNADESIESEFRWPIHLHTLKECSPMSREGVLQEALCATVFMRQAVQVKWYQQTFWRFFIIYLVIVIVIYTQQYKLLGTIGTLATTALTTGAVGTAVAWAALYVVMTFALGYLISFAANLMPEGIGQIFVIVIAIYMAGGTDFFQNIGTSFRNLATSVTWGSAVQFINAVSPLLQIGQTIYENRAMGRIDAQYRELLKTAKEKQQILDDAWDSLGETPSWLDPLDLARAMNAKWYNEKPENFIQNALRTNPGVLGYDLIGNFATIALRLPEGGGGNNVLDEFYRMYERQRGAV